MPYEVEPEQFCEKKQENSLVSDVDLVHTGSLGEDDQLVPLAPSQAGHLMHHHMPGASEFVIIGAVAEGPHFVAVDGTECYGINDLK